MADQGLEDLYVRLAKGLTEAGDNYFAVLSRPVLLLTKYTTDQNATAGLIYEACQTGAPRKSFAESS